MRLYDTQKQRKPLIDMSFGEHPIISVAVSNDSKYENSYYKIQFRFAFIGNTVGDVCMVDLDRQSVHCKFQGVTGSVKSICFIESMQAIAVASIDRFLRIYSISDGKQPLIKLYLKQRLTQITKTDDLFERTAKKDDIDEIWNEMAVVEEPQSSKAPQRKKIKV